MIKQEAILKSPEGANRQKKGGITMKFFKIFRFKVDFQMSQGITWNYRILILGLTLLSLWSRFDNIREGANSPDSPVTIYLPADVAPRKTEFLIRHNHIIFSAVYEAHKALWHKVDLRKYFYSKHAKNLDSMEKGMLASLGHFKQKLQLLPVHQNEMTAITT